MPVMGGHSPDKESRKDISDSTNILKKDRERVDIQLATDT